MKMAVALAAAATLATASVAAEPARFTYSRSAGSWLIAGGPADGTCVAWPTTEGSTKLTIGARAADETLQFVILNEAWKSIADGNLRVRATFHDRSGAITDLWDLDARGYSVDAGGPKIMFDILRAKNDSASFVDQFRQASEVWFWRDIDVPLGHFSLKASAEMIDRLLECRALLRADKDFDPFAR